jgi:hypothetical protein
MAYAQIADMRDSRSLARRIAACAAQQGYADPQTWTALHSWDWAATPGWDGKWASAVEKGTPDPGADDAAITDGDILARVDQIGDDPAAAPNTQAG